jgi:hypothetical protein
MLLCASKYLKVHRLVKKARADSFLRGLIKGYKRQYEPKQTEHTNGWEQKNAALAYSIFNDQFSMSIIHQSLHDRSLLLPILLR